MASASGGGLKGAEALELSRHMGDLANAGVPLGKGLAALSQELPNGRLAAAMREIASAVEAGQTLEQAVSTDRLGLPGNLRGLAIAGARTGRLGDVLAQLSGYAGVGDEIRRTLRLKLMYPILLLLGTFSIFTFISIVVVAQFELIYKDFHIPLPALTQLMLLVSAIFRAAAIPALWLGSAILVAWLIVRYSVSRKVRRSLASRIPIAGAVWRTISLSEFCHVLGLLLESRMPLPEALPLAGQAVDNTTYDHASLSMAREIQAGGTLARAMNARTLFPVGLPRLIAWGEQQLTLPEVLHMAASMYESQARAQASVLASVVGAVCAVAVFMQILIIPALFIPLITLISRLSG